MDIWTQLSFLFLVGSKILRRDNTSRLSEVQYKLEEEHLFLGEIFVLGWIFVCLFIYLWDVWDGVCEETCVSVGSNRDPSAHGSRSQLR